MEKKVNHSIYRIIRPKAYNGFKPRLRKFKSNYFYDWNSRKFMYNVDTRSGGFGLYPGDVIAVNVGWECYRFYIVLGVCVGFACKYVESGKLDSDEYNRFKPHLALIEIINISSKYKEKCYKEKIVPDDKTYRGYKWYLTSNSAAEYSLVWPETYATRTNKLRKTVKILARLGKDHFDSMRQMKLESF